MLFFFLTVVVVFSSLIVTSTVLLLDQLVHRLRLALVLIFSPSSVSTPAVQ
jgi:hypothetical protein